MMIRMRFVVCFACCLLGPAAAVAADDGFPLDAYGVWDRGMSFSFQQMPWLKGLSFNADWEHIETEPGVFDWSGLDQAAKKAADNQRYLTIAINPGPDAPQWIYDRGVPKVVTDDEQHRSKWQHYPYYLAPAYRQFYFRMVRSMGKHVVQLPPEYRHRIAFIQVKTGCTGDECPYKGRALDPQYEIAKDSPQWREFRLAAFRLYVDLFQSDPDHRIPLLFNAVGGGTDSGYAEEWDWLVKNIPGGFGIKNGALSRGHHLRGERVLYEQWIDYLVNPQGLRLFRRSEMDQTWRRPWYQRNLALNFYWGAVNAIHGGQSVWDITTNALEMAEREGCLPAIEFFNKYAGQIDPTTATDAFCALHKGLDASDITAYPEDQFGEANPRNVDRMLAICQAYAPYGARVEDPAALRMGQVAQRRSQRGFNDVGWEIWPDNYFRFLYQIDADATCVPRWHVGGEITADSPIYARFARGFEHASGKDALYFRLDGAFFHGRQPKTITVGIVWYDAQAGSSWKLVYDAGQETMKTAATITGRGDRKWHQQTLRITDAVLDHGGERGSDLAVINTDERDDLFSLIEVHREPVARDP